MRGTEFLPVSREEMLRRDWYYYDFLVVTADAYIDHPSFGTTLIARMLEGGGYRVAILAQPDWRGPEAFRSLGAPGWGCLSPQATSTLWWPTTPPPASATPVGRR